MLRQIVKVRVYIPKKNSVERNDLVRSVSIGGENGEGHSKLYLYTEGPPLSRRMGRGAIRGE